jgi:hypothetical protein
MREVRELARIITPMENRKGEIEENCFMKPFKLFSESHEGWRFNRET